MALYGEPIVIGGVGWGFVGGSLAAALGTLTLGWYLLRHRGDGGAGWFVGALAAQALWTVGYTAGLFAFDPSWRALFEGLRWVGIAWLGPPFLGFALAYTGRSDLVRSRAFRALLVVPSVTVVLALTNPWHHLLWRNLHLVPTFGLATVRYDLQPWSYLAAGVSLATAAIGVLLLVETIVSYGSFYRREAVAVAISTLPPAAAFIAWLGGVTPWPALDLTPLAFLPHVLLDAYAFVGTHMFETNPATQRAAERSALRDLRNPLLVVDANARVVNSNRRARELFRDDAIRRSGSVGDVVGVDLESLRDAGELDLGGTNETVYSLSHTPLTGPQGDALGAILVFYDITRERRQRQRLSVLERVLRHNLRNSMSVVSGRAELIRRETADRAIDEHAAVVTRTSERLMDIAESVGEFNRLQSRELSVEPLAPASIAESVVDALRDEYPEATITIDPRGEQRVESDAVIVETALRELLENAVVHAETDTPTVGVTVDDADTGVVFEIRDGNDRIPKVETNALSSIEESALEHGSGIGLWIASWCLDLVGGDLSFAYRDGNVVRVVLPADARDGTELDPLK